jgi:formate dehydrogenase major subunit
MVTDMNNKKRIPTVCPYCGVGCKFLLLVEEGQAIGLDYMSDHFVSGGRLCAKGNAALEILSHPDRLRHPMTKTDGGWEHISWNEALDMVAEKLLSIAHSQSADTLGFLASAKCTNEENYLFQKLARLLGTNNVDHCARLCHSPTVVGLARALGSGAMTNPLPDLVNSDCIFIIGANPAANHAPALHWIWQAKDRGADVIVADPRRTPTAWMADEFLQLRSGSDVALLNAMAYVIISEGLADSEFIKNRTEGYGTLRQAVMDYPPQKAADITGIPVAQILDASRRLARADAASIVYCMGITQHTVGSDNVAACANLALLTGNVGKPGAGVMPLRGQNNVQGACDMGALPQFLPGYLPVIDKGLRSRVAEMWQTDSLPAEPGLTVVEMMKAAGQGLIKAMWIMGEDPVNSDPNASEVKEALSALEFLVVQDIFLTETAKMADLVLPAAAWAEKSGTFTNTERRVQWFDQAVKSPGDGQPDLWIINQIGKRLGLELGEHDASGVLGEINQIVAAYGGISRERAAAKDGIHWPCPEAGHPGTPILHAERFSLPGGKAQFVPVTFLPPAESVSDNYPLILTTGRLALHYNSGSMTHRTALLMDRIASPRLEMNPVDAQLWNIEDGKSVSVSTPRGQVTAVAWVTDAVERGVVFLPFHFPGINTLTTDALDADAKIPEYKVAACRVEKGGQG